MNKKNNINVALLKSFLKENTYISGSSLAKTLGISRVAVWNHLEQLREQGFTFSAVRNKGYQLVNEPKYPHHDLLLAYLKEDLPATLVFKDEVDSTQNEVERLIAADQKTPIIVVGKVQTKGRGRLGRKWHGDDERNLKLSFGFKPKISANELKKITPWFAINLCELINNELSVEAKIKWPNDLMVNEKKVCGMLVESRMDMDQTRDIILGIGLNVAGNIPEELKDRAENLQSASEKTLSINHICAKAILRILDSYNEIKTNKFQEKMKQLWNRYDILYDKKITCHRKESSKKGIAKGINDNGLLRLLLPNGKIELLDYSEVSLNKQ